MHMQMHMPIDEVLTDVEILVAVGLGHGHLVARKPPPARGTGVRRARRKVLRAGHHPAPPAAARPHQEDEAAAEECKGAASASSSSGLVARESSGLSSAGLSDSPSGTSSWL